MSGPHTVLELEALGWLHVEDGNHGEQRPRQNEFGSGTTRFIRAADMEAGRVLFDQAEVINDAALARIRKGIGMPGDVLFSHKGTVGKLAIVPSDAPPFVCSPQTTFWRSLDPNKIDQRFLYEYLHGEEFSEQWRARKGETDMADYVSLSAQRQLVLNLPEIHTQRAVGAVLGALDDKIAANRTTNRVLERVASALFNSWFTDFDPVVAKRDGKTPIGVPADAIDLFPSHFEESELGPMPQDWQVVTVRNVCEFSYGKALPERARRAGSVPVFGSNGIVGSHAQSLVDGPGIVVGRKGTAGIVTWAPTDFFPIDTTFYVSPRPVIPMSWLYEALLDLDLARHSGDSAVPGLNRGTAHSLKIVRPPDELLRCFDQLWTPLRNSHDHNQRESRTLADIRDALLGPILSGELTIRSAEQAVGAAL